MTESIVEARTDLVRLLNNLRANVEASIVARFTISAISLVVLDSMFGEKLSRRERKEKIKRRTDMLLTYMDAWRRGASLQSMGFGKKPQVITKHRHWWQRKALANPSTVNV